MIPRPLIPPSSGDVRRGNTLLAPQPKRMQLIDWRPVNKGALAGRAKVALPIGLEIDDIGVFWKDGRSWAQLPSQMLRDADGQPVFGNNGKARYVSPIRWATRELQDRWSDAVVALVLAEHPDAFE